MCVCVHTFNTEIEEAVIPHSKRTREIESKAHHTRSSRARASVCILRRGFYERWLHWMSLFMCAVPISTRVCLQEHTGRRASLDIYLESLVHITFKRGVSE